MLLVYRRNHSRVKVSRTECAHDFGPKSRGLELAAAIRSFMAERSAPIVAPRLAIAQRPTPLDEEQKNLYENVEAHFANPGFKVASDPPTELTVDEKFWLVRERLNARF